MLAAGAEFLTGLCAEGMFATGAQLAVSTDGGAPRTMAVGRQVGDRPLRSSHLFNVWCASKPVVAILLMALVEDAGLALSDQISAADERFGKAPRLTFATLLNHSCGMQHPDMVTANLLPRHEALAQARHSSPMPPFDAFSEFSSGVITVDLIEHLSGTDIAAVADRFLEANGLEADITFQVSQAALARPLDHLGFYLVDSGGMARPMYCDAIDFMARDDRHILGAYANAAGLCGFYRRVGRVLAGTPQAGFPSPEFLIDAISRHGRGRVWDETLSKECGFAAGFMTSLRDHGYGAAVSGGAVGHTGLMGSPFGFYDPDRRLAAAAILNGMSMSSQDSEYWRSQLVAALTGAADRAHPT